MRHKEKTQEELTAEQEVMKLAREKLKVEKYNKRYMSIIRTNNKKCKRLLI